MSLKKIAVIFFLIVAVVWAGKGIFKYNIFSTHDGNHHLSRAYDAIQTIKEGHFPLRWAGSLNYLCGVPIFNFFYPLIYYLVIGINFIGFDVILSFKLIYFLSLLVGTLFFYFWMMVETKNKLPSLGGAFLYLYAPYRFSLIFVRGSPEFLAYAILPVVLYFYSKLVYEKENKSIYYAFAASISGALLAISHNFTVMFLFPIILGYLFLKYLTEKISFLKLKWIALSFISSFGFSAFFIGPAILEKRFTRIGENFLIWQEHFPTLGQLIRSPWGYFYSSQGTINDGMSFMLGYAHWVVLLLAAVFIIYSLFKNKVDKWSISLFVVSLFVIYLILPISIPLWEKLPLLQEIQFSWRLLGVAVFTISALFSFVLNRIENKKIMALIFIFISLLAYYGNRNHLLPQPVSVEEVYKYDDYNKLHQHRYSTTTLGDDVIAKGAKTACWFNDPFLSTDRGEIKHKIVEQGNTYGFVKYDLSQKNLETSKFVKVKLGFFPGAYNFEVNGQKADSFSCDGKNCFDISYFKTGENTLSWKIVQTPTQKMFNILTILFLIMWIILLLINKFGKDKKGKTFLLSLVIVFLIFIFFRTYNLEGRLGFGWDQERDIIAVKEILSGDLKLIGPRVYGPAGFFLPPYFFYILAPFYFAGNLNPFSVIWFIAASSVLFFILSFKIITQVFNQKTALFFLGLWAVNPLAISIDTIAWNPIFVPLLFLAVIYFFYISLKTLSDKNIFLLGLFFGFGVSFHLQFIFIFPMLLPIFYNIFNNRDPAKFLKFLIGAIIPFLPILIFDLRHDFLNFKQIFLFEGFGGNSVNRLLPVWGNVSSFIFGVNSNISVGVIGYILLIVGYLLLFITAFKKTTGDKPVDELNADMSSSFRRIPRQYGGEDVINEKNKELKQVYLGLFLVVMVSLPIFRFLIKNPSEYYFNYLIVPIMILISILFSRLKRSGVVICIFIIIYLAFKSFPLLNDANLGLKQKNNAVVFLNKITKDSGAFNVSFDVPFNEDSGFRYLLKYNNVPVSGKDSDPLIEFVIPSNRKKTSFTVGRIGISIPRDFLNVGWLGKM